MKEILDQITPFWCFSTLILGSILGVVFGVIANRTDRKIEKLLNRLSEQRRERSEASKAYFEKCAAQLRTSDALQREYLARGIFFSVLCLVYTFVGTSMIAVAVLVYLALPSYLLSNSLLPLPNRIDDLIVAMAEVSYRTLGFPFGFLFLFGVFMVMLGAARLYRAAWVFDVIRAANKTAQVLTTDKLEEP
ncbi:MAG: hypothetical protein KC547_17125 [Anaerolineae bacterium]|nr:hypothetical protein [Anaerolineae bacterium]